MFQNRQDKRTETLPSSRRPEQKLEIFTSEHGSLMLWLMAGLTFLGVGGSGLWTYLSLGRLISPIAIPALLTLLVVFYFLYQGRLPAAIKTYLWGMVFASLFAASQVAGVYSPALMLMPLLIMIAALLEGSRYAWRMCFVICLSIGIITWLQTNDYLPPLTLRDPIFILIALLCLCLVGSVLGSMSISSINSQYRKSLDLTQQLVELNLQLEGKVDQRTKDLASALERLQRTQDDLIQSEKLAALGGMVAGISHELNTPIGNSMMLASTLKDRALAMQNLLAGDKIRRSELVGGMASLTEMAQLLERSNERAASLIVSFKQVAVDQVSERRRSFDLRQVVEETLITLRPGLKHQPWIIDNQVPHGIVCDSFPGPLEQVLTNLIQNAIMHGFAGLERGRVEISATTDQGSLEVVVADDGVGMDTATTMRIFEPFFTTRLGQGGSGLGLAICFRIASTILTGELRVKSSSGTGTQFILRMPLRTPGKL